MTNDHGGFLARWSRRKQEAKRTPAIDAEPAPPPGMTDAQEAPAIEVMAPETPADEPIAIEDLPAIDSIDADTDLTQWLKRPVPAVWRQAALRKLWLADPAIRDFVGLADYAWDFNAPGSMPGFGALDPGGAGPQTVAQAIGQAAPAPGDGPVAANSPSETCGETTRSVPGSDTEAARSAAMQNISDGRQRPETGSPSAPQSSLRLTLANTSAPTSSTAWDGEPGPASDEPPTVPAAPQQNPGRLKSHVPIQLSFWRRGGGATPV
jgi:hypothetical protein